MLPDNIIFFKILIYTCDFISNLLKHQEITDKAKYNKTYKKLYLAKSKE